MARDEVQILVQKMRQGAHLPHYASSESAGADLCACLEQPITIEAGGRALVPTGLAIQLPPGFEAQVRPRSGLALRHGIGVLNSPGTIDSDYRGEVLIILINHGSDPFVVEDGQRIAQMVVSRCERAAFTIVSVLDESDRGRGGFGSTGV